MTIYIYGNQKELLESKLVDSEVERKVHDPDPENLKISPVNLNKSKDVLMIPTDYATIRLKQTKPNDKLKKQVELNRGLHVQINFEDTHCFLVISDDLSQLTTDQQRDINDFAKQKKLTVIYADDLTPQVVQAMGPFTPETIRTELENIATAKHEAENEAKLKEIEEFLEKHDTDLDDVKTLSSLSMSVPFHKKYPECDDLLRHMRQMIRNDPNEATMEKAIAITRLFKSYVNAEDENKIWVLREAVTGKNKDKNLIQSRQTFFKPGKTETEKLITKMVAELMQSPTLNNR